MLPEDLYGILHRKSFQPFRVHLKNGRCYDIRYPHLSVVGKTYFAIGIPPADDPAPRFYDYVDTVDLADIDRVELLEAWHRCRQTEMR